MQIRYMTKTLCMFWMRQLSRSSAYRKHHRSISIKEGGTLSGLWNSLAISFINMLNSNGLRMYVHYLLLDIFQKCFHQNWLKRKCLCSCVLEHCKKDRLFIVTVIWQKVHHARWNDTFLKSIKHVNNVPFFLSQYFSNRFLMINTSSNVLASFL